MILAGKHSCCFDVSTRPVEQSFSYFLPKERNFSFELRLLHLGSFSSYKVNCAQNHFPNSLLIKTVVVAWSEFGCVVDNIIIVFSEKDFKVSLLQFAVPVDINPFTPGFTSRFVLLLLSVLYKIRG